jgi:hypothetical protein
MGIWGRLKTAFGGNSASEPDEDIGVTRRRSDEEVQKAARDKRYAATSAHYASEKRNAARAGQTVRGYRAGYISAEVAKDQLAPGPDGMPPLKLVSSKNGLDLALPSGQLIDYKILALRHFKIFAFRVVGMGYYESPEKPFKLRNGQRVGLVREPENEHDPNAVAITIGRPGRKIGYVNKQRARWVAELLDDGQDLDALVIQTQTSSPRVLITTPETLAYLRRT